MNQIGTLGYKTPLQEEITPTQCSCSLALQENRIPNFSISERLKEGARNIHPITIAMTSTTPLVTMHPKNFPKNSSRKKPQKNFRSVTSDSQSAREKAEDAFHHHRHDLNYAIGNNVPEKTQKNPKKIQIDSPSDTKFLPKRDHRAALHAIKQNRMDRDLTRSCGRKRKRGTTAQWKTRSPRTPRPRRSGPGTAAAPWPRPWPSLRPPYSERSIELWRSQNSENFFARATAKPLGFSNGRDEVPLSSL